MALDIPLQKTSTGQQQSLSFLGLKIWSKISHSTENVKAKAKESFRLNPKKEILSKLFK